MGLRRAEPSVWKIGFRAFDPRASVKLVDVLRFDHVELAVSNAGPAVLGDVVPA
ncbi:MAG TPA: hypothetical protein VFG30_05355 [Polyangiales bacterium]|nr:hypothetical protein [Polyangiales bacterium]